MASRHIVATSLLSASPGQLLVEPEMALDVEIRQAANLLAGHCYYLKIRSLSVYFSLGFCISL